MFIERLKNLKLKHVWVLTILCLIYIAFKEPLALESLLLKMVQVWIGALIGYGIDAVHFYFNPPSEKDAAPHNSYRRTIFMCVGMLAASL